MKLEANGHVVAYCDTDSLLSFPVNPEAPELEKLCQISDRLGCLKVEREGISKFFSTAAKTYSLETVTGEVTIKAKGFNLLEKLLKDNSAQGLLEKNVTKMFTGVSDYSNLPDPSTLVFQKQIKVNPLQLVPALVPSEKSYKLLNFIGPRRLVDIDNWVDFKYERVLVADLEKSVIEPLTTWKPTDANVCDTLLTFARDEKEVPEEENDVSENEKSQAFKVVLVPTIKGFLPALPYGFNFSQIDRVLSYYSLSDSV